MNLQDAILGACCASIPKQKMETFSLLTRFNPESNGERRESILGWWFGHTSCIAIDLELLAGLK